MILRRVVCCDVLLFERGLVRDGFPVICVGWLGCFSGLVWVSYVDLVVWFLFCCSWCVCFCICVSAGFDVWTRLWCG